MNDSSQESSDNVHPLTWSDAFPWLEGASERTDAPWWTDPIANTPPDTRSTRLSIIAELAMLRLTRWSIGQIFPGLPANIDLLRLDMSTRARNVLGRNGFTKSQDLMVETLDDVMSWRNVGAGTIRTILEILADASTSNTTPTVLSPEASSIADHRSAPTDAKAQWLSLLENDLLQIAYWYCAVGANDQPLFGRERDDAKDIPPTVAEAIDRVQALQPVDILLPDDRLDVAALFTKALSSLDERAVNMLKLRLFADDPAKLERLGQLHGVTRERARQIEGKARGSLLSAISGDGLLASVAITVRTLIGTVRPLDDLLELVPALAGNVDRVGQPAWRILDRLDDAYEIEDGWCVAPTMASAQALTDSLLQEKADEFGVLPLQSIKLIESSFEEKSTPLHRSWLTHCGYTLHGDFVLTRTSSVGDYAAAVLSLNGSPLSAQEIVNEFGVKRSVGSTRNALALDDRFERVDRDRWALSGWGLEAYEGIRSVIRELVARGGGQARLDHVIEYITARYTVSSNSVVAYASAPPFMTRDGVVQPSRDRAPRKSPEETKRLFRREGGWALRIKITADHLRGSGFVAPVAVATLLSLRPGESTQLESRLGPQNFAWTGIQPQFGTIRRFLLEEDIPVDAQVFLVIHDDKAFSFEVARQLTDNPVIDAVSRVGAPMTTSADTARSALATAVGLKPEAPVSSIVGSYRARGDDDIADLVLEARVALGEPMPQTSTSRVPDVDEIMDLL